MTGFHGQHSSVGAPVCEFHVSINLLNLLNMERESMTISIGRNEYIATTSLAFVAFSRPIEYSSLFKSYTTRCDYLPGNLENSYLLMM